MVDWGDVFCFDIEDGYIFAAVHGAAGDRQEEDCAVLKKIIKKKC
jgi:hypothetical protein